MQAYKKHTYTLLEVQPGDAILDVGCGTGDDVHVLAEMVGPTGRVVGVDCSETMIAAALQRQKPDLPVEFLVNNAHCLNFANNTFDQVQG